MVAFLIFSALALAFAGAVAIPFILLGAFFWLITFPIRLLFKLIGGIFGMVFWWSRPGSAIWNDALMTNIARPCWMAVTRRVVKLRPSRTRSTL